MPSAIPDPQLRSNTASPATHFSQQSRKSYDRTSIGNAFVWTSDMNGDHGHVDSSSDFVLKSGSLQSLAPVSKTNSSVQQGERSRSRTGSLLSLEALSVRDNGGRHVPNGWSYPQDEHHPNYPFTNGFSEHRTPTVNGASSSSRRRSPSPRTVVNGDHSSTSDYQASSDITPQTSVAPSVPNGLTPPKLSQHNQYHVHPQHPPLPVPRQSSPSPVASTVEPPSSPSSSYNPPRTTLQVPKFTPGRKSSQSAHTHPPSNAVNASEDTLATSDRFSTDRVSSDRFPSSAPSGLRRASLSLARRAPRAAQSDLQVNEAPQDEEAARWTETIKHRRASKRRRRDDDDDERVIVGTKVDQNHVNWVTAYNMLTGIRFTVSRTNAKIDHELTDADFETKHKFSFDITGNELTPSAKYDFKFKDYAPSVFRRLRAKFQLDPADYLVSLTSKYILSELGSPGKSGSFFYFSRDYKYIIKTIHHAEHKLLRRILRDYYQHIENNPNTLISQFYGLHRVKMAYGRKIHFVVMNNLFPPHRDIHHMFDLKGSTVGRDFREDDLDKNPRATLKDLNWLRRDRHLELGPMKRDIFLAQLRRDVALLQRLKIMDYSLLVGIHDTSKGNEEKLRDRTLQVFQPGAELSEDQQSNLLMRTPSRLENARKARELREIIKREKPVPLQNTAAKMPDEILDERKNLVFYSDDGGFRATHENNEAGTEIYYLGVIDCLTHYGLVKKAEHFWKGLSQNRNQISPIPPVAYGERFLNFVTGITKSREEAEREAKEKESTSQSQEVRRSSVERTMEKARKQAAKSHKTLADEPEPRERVLSTVRTPGPDLPGTGPSTLPILEEIGEASSGRSETDPVRNGDSARPHTPHSFRTAEAPSGPPPSAPPPPPGDYSRSPQSKGKMREYDSEKGLPPLPNGPPPTPPKSSFSRNHAHNSHLVS